MRSVKKKKTEYNLFFLDTYKDRDLNIEQNNNSLFLSKKGGKFVKDGLATLITFNNFKKIFIYNFFYGK